jgi:hypothetical protein
MSEGRFGHQGNLCTFESMPISFGLKDAGLQEMAEIVHEIDLSDGKYLRPATAGVDAVLQGWRLAGFSDNQLEAHGVALFEGLYSSLARAARAVPAKQKRSAS